MMNRCLVPLNIILDLSHVELNLFDMFVYLWFEPFLYNLKVVCKAHGTLFCHLKTLVERFEKLYFVLHVLLLYAKHE